MPKRWPKICPKDCQNMSERCTWYSYKKYKQSFYWFHCVLKKNVKIIIHLTFFNVIWKIWNEQKSLNQLAPTQEKSDKQFYDRVEPPNEADLNSQHSNWTTCSKYFICKVMIWDEINTHKIRIKNYIISTNFVTSKRNIEEQVWKGMIYLDITIWDSILRSV